MTQHDSPSPKTITEQNLYSSAGRIADALSCSLEWILDAATRESTRTDLHTKLDHEIGRIGRLRTQQQRNAQLKKKSVAPANEP